MNIGFESVRAIC